MMTCRVHVGGDFCTERLMLCQRANHTRIGNVGPLPVNLVHMATLVETFCRRLG